MIIFIVMYTLSHWNWDCVTHLCKIKDIKIFSYIFSCAHNCHVFPVKRIFKYLKLYSNVFTNMNNCRIVKLFVWILPQWCLILIHNICMLNITLSFEVWLVILIASVALSLLKYTLKNCLETTNNEWLLFLCYLRFYC